MALELTPTSAVDPAVAEAMQVYARLQTVRNVLAPDLNDVELQLFAMVANQSRLDPFAKQIYAIKRNTRNGPRLTFQTGIDGFRSSAEDTNEYRGSDEPEYGPWIEQPFGHPEWAKVVVHRQYANGEWLHQPATVYWSEFYPGEQQGYTWKQMPRVMLAKCAEAAAFRKAFPKRFGQVYTAEEMERQDMGPAPVIVHQTARERAQARLAAVTDAAASQQQPAGVATSVGTASPAATEPDPPPASPVEVEPVVPSDAAPSTVQCESMSPYDHPTQCQREAGHSGTHRNRDKESWS